MMRTSHVCMNYINAINSNASDSLQVYRFYVYSHKQAGTQYNIIKMSESSPCLDTSNLTLYIFIFI